MTELQTLYKKLCSNYQVDTQKSVLEALKSDGHLDISQQTLLPSTCAVLGKIFETTNYITKVLLENCLLEEESLKLLLLGLANTCSVVFLNLKGNSIHGSSTLRVAELLKTNTSIKSLTLEWNNLGICNSSFTKLCEGLIHNRSLARLDLRSNQLNGEAGKAIANVILKTTSLTTLDLRFNSIGNEGGKAILQAIRFNHTVTSLLINGNSISDEIMNDIAYHLSNSLKISAVKDEYVTQIDMLKQRLKLQDQHSSTHVANLEKSLTNANDSLTSVIRDSQAKIGALEDSITSKTEELQRLTIKHESLSSTLEDREKNIEILKRKNHNMEMELQKARESQEMSFKEINEMRDIQMKWDSCKQENWALKEKLIALDTELKATKSDNEAEIDAERTKHRDAQRKVEKQSSTQIVKLKKEIEDKEGEMKRSKKLWESARDELEGEVRTLKNNLTAREEKHQVQLSSLKHQLRAENRHELQILENQLKETQLNREEVEAKLRQQISSCSSLTSANARFESQIHSLKAEITSLQAEVEEKEGNIRIAEQRVRNELKKQLDELQDLKEERQKLKENVDHERRMREQMKNELQSSLHGKGEEILRLKSRIEEKEEELVRFKENELKKAALLQTAFMQYLRPSTHAPEAL